MARRVDSRSWIRFVWGGLALLLLLALAGTVFLSRGEIKDKERAAQSAAQERVGSVLFGAVRPDELAAPPEGSDFRSLNVTVQRRILSDDAIVRVRIWSPSGSLLYSSDQRDAVGQAVAGADQRVQEAAGGDTVSVATDAQVPSEGGLAGSDERLYETFVPLRLASQSTVSAVVEVDRRYAAIQNEADSVWRPVQIGLLAALIVMVVLFGLSLREPAERVSVAAGSGAPAASSARTERHEANLAERLRDAEKRSSEIEKELKEARARLAASDKDVGARLGEADQELKELRSRLAASDEATTTAHRRVATAEQDAATAQQAALQARKAAEAAERRVAELELAGSTPHVRGEGPAGSVSVEAVALAEQVEKQNGEIRRLRAALGEREAELALAREGARPGEADAALANAAVEVTREQVAALESQLHASEQRAAEAEQRIRDVEGELRALAAAKASLEGATSESDEQRTEELRATQLELNELRLKLNEAESRLHDSGASESEKEEALAKLREQHSSASTELESVRAILARTEEELAAVKRAAADASQERSAPEPTAVENLRARIEELEGMRRDDIAALQRAQEALANTQVELTKATKRAKEAEAKVFEMAGSPGGPDLAAGPAAPAGSEAPARSGEATERSAAPEPVEEAELVSVPPTEEGSEPSIAARLASRRRKAREEPAALPAPPDGASPEEPGEEAPSEEALSLRERLARAAAARHRTGQS